MKSSYKEPIITSMMMLPIGSILATSAIAGSTSTGRDVVVVADGVIVVAMGRITVVAFGTTVKADTVAQVISQKRAAMKRGLIIVAAVFFLLLFVQNESKSAKKNGISKCMRTVYSTVVQVCTWICQVSKRSGSTR